MELHRFFKKNERILEYFLSRLPSVTFAVVFCSSASYSWIDAFCQRVHLSYVNVHEMDMTHAKKVGPMLLGKPSLLYVFTDGTEFWIIKSFLENCKQFPSLIVTSFNYIMGWGPTITTPFPKNNAKKQLYDINYQGCSLHGLVALLRKYKYRYTGLFRYAQGVVFVRDDEYRSMHPFQEPVPEDMLTLPNVTYALEHRWPKVKHKFWIQVHG